MTSGTNAFRASVFHFKEWTEDPSFPSYEYIEDGLLISENGFVQSIGSYTELKDTLPGTAVFTDYSGKLIMPGFVDCHIHYSQTDIIASPGGQLLEWLEKHTYPAEMKFNDRRHASETARFFFDELLRNGTTSALVLPTVHPESVHALFDEAEQRDLRIVSGKIMMDRNAPDGLKDTADQSYDECSAIIERWHLKNRLSCAVIPRFALTSSEEQLKAAAALMNETPGLLFHTHLSENMNEAATIMTRFPSCRSYLDVYDRFGLAENRSVFAHGIHLDRIDYRRLAETRSAITLCPTSNLFLGSGLFDLETMEKHGIKTGFGTDVGAGTSFSMFKTMAEAYKVCQLKGYSLSPFKAFYMATLGGARILGIDGKTGNFEKGKEADFIVIDPQTIPLLQRRMNHAESIEDVLFALMILGDDRIVKACYVLGRDRTPTQIG